MASRAEDTLAVVAGPADTSEHPELVAEKLSRAVKVGDWGAVLGFVADDCELALFDKDETYRGPEEIGGYFKGLLEHAEEWRVDVKIEVAPTGALVVAVHLSGREKGKHFEPMGGGLYYVIDLRAGKLAKCTEYRRYFDARAAAKLAEPPGWRDRLREAISATAMDFTSVTRLAVAYAVKWYRAHEAALIGGALIILTAGWVLFCTATFQASGVRPGLKAYVIVNNVVVFSCCIGALITAVIIRASTWRLFYWLVVLLAFFVLGFAGMYWSIGTPGNFDDAGQNGLSPLDATYFAFGTVSTGTGNINASSQSARGLQLIQMLVGMVLILVVVSAIVSRLTSGGDRDIGNELTARPTETGGHPDG